MTNTEIPGGQLCTATFLGSNPSFITTTACNILAVNGCNLGLAQVMSIHHVHIQ